MDYLCIDTNIYIQCCLLEIEGDDFKSLKQLHDLLDKNKITLLLPEVIELEFYDKLEKKYEKLKKQIDDYKEKISLDKSLNPKIKNDLRDKLSAFMQERSQNKLEVEDEIKKIFSHKNTEKEGLKICPDDITNAYKSFLIDQKPYKPRVEDRDNKDLNPNCIQPDCLIIEALKRFFKSKSAYKFYLCSDNKSDFAKESKLEGDLKIHEDISKQFEHIEYSINLLKLLNDKFGAQFPQDLIDKIQEQEQIDVIEDTNKVEPTIAATNLEEIKSSDIGSAASPKEN